MGTSTLSPGSLKSSRTLNKYQQNCFTSLLFFNLASLHSITKGYPCGSSLRAILKGRGVNKPRSKMCCTKTLSLSCFLWESSQKSKLLGITSRITSIDITLCSIFFGSSFKVQHSKFTVLSKFYSFWWESSIIHWRELYIGGIDWWKVESLKWPRSDQIVPNGHLNCEHFTRITIHKFSG